MSVESFDTDDFETLSTSMELVSPTTNPEDSVPLALHEQQSQAVQNDSLVHESAETGPTKPIELDSESLIALLQETQGFELQNGVYRFGGAISAAASERLYKGTSKITGLTLSDLDGLSIAPSVFTRLSRLRTPAGDLFPSLSTLAIKKGNSHLEFLSLFVSPALQRLKFIGINEHDEPSFAAFLKATAEEAPKLSSIQLGHNRLSSKTVEIVASFAHLNTLHLIDTLSAFDYRFLEALGRIESLVDLTLCQSGGSLEYRSHAIVLADEEQHRREQDEKRHQEEEEARLLVEAERKAEEEKERVRVKLQNEMEVRRKLEDAKALLSALGPRGEALVSHLDAQDAMSEPQAGESPTPADPVPMGSFGQTSFWGCSSPAEPCPVPAANDEVPPADMSWGGPGNTPTIDEPPVDLWGRGIPKKKKGKRKEAFGLWGASSCHEPSPQVERLSTHPTDELFFGGHSKASSSPPLLSAFPSPPTSPAPSVYSRSSTPELKNINLAFATPQGSQILFQNLQTLSATGSTEMISDLVNVIHSTSMKSISITFFTPEVQTIHPSAVVRLAICKWFGSISQVTIEAENSSFPPSRSTLPKAVFKKLLLAPLIRCLDLKGWKIEELDASLAALSRLESSKLEHLSLPFHSEAPGISLTRLGFIADSCPSLLSLKCRLKHLSNVPTTSEWSSSNTRNYNFSNLTVGNVDAHPKIDRALDIARYIDRLFPAINTLKTPDGPGQNAEQWELIGKIVKMLQEVRLEKL